MKKPLERGKSLQEVVINPESPGGGYERGRSPDELTSVLRKEVGTRYVHHRGSVRANFTSPGGSSFLTRLVHWLNKTGKEKRGHSLLCFHKKGRTRKFCKKIMKSRYMYMEAACFLHMCSNSLHTHCSITQWLHKQARMNKYELYGVRI